MKPKVIKTEAEHQATLARIEAIFDARPGTPKGDELELLLLLVETDTGGNCHSGDERPAGSTGQTETGAPATARRR